MKIIEVPVYNDDGSVKATMMISPEEAKHLLEFAINFMAAMGNTVQIAVGKPDDQQELKFND